MLTTFFTTHQQNKSTSFPICSNICHYNFCPRYTNDNFIKKSIGNVGCVVCFYNVYNFFSSKIVAACSFAAASPKPNHYQPPTTTTTSTATSNNQINNNSTDMDDHHHHHRQQPNQSTNHQQQKTNQSTNHKNNNQRPPAPHSQTLLTRRGLGRCSPHSRRCHCSWTTCPLISGIASSRLALRPSPQKSSWPRPQPSSSGRG